MIGYQTAKKANKPWVSEKMIEKMEERRNYKNVNTEVVKKKYRSLNHELRRETDKAREEWWSNEWGVVIWRSYINWGDLI